MSFSLFVFPAVGIFSFTLGLETIGFTKLVLFKLFSLDIWLLSFSLGVKPLIYVDSYIFEGELFWDDPLIYVDSYSGDLSLSRWLICLDCELSLELDNREFSLGGLSIISDN